MKALGTEGILDEKANCSSIVYPFTCVIIYDALIVQQVWFILQFID